MPNNTINLSAQDYCNFRDSLFQEISKVGRDYGFADVSINVRDTLQNGEKFDWDLKVTFRKEK